MRQGSNPGSSLNPINPGCAVPVAGGTAAASRQTRARSLAFTTGLDQFTSRQVLTIVLEKLFSLGINYL
jgi:hypothetical protein